MGVEYSGIFQNGNNRICEKLADIINAFYGVDSWRYRFESARLADFLFAQGVTVNGVENGTVETVTDCNGLKPKTNLDHVRTLPAEDLARCMSDWQDWGGGLDPEYWLEWLQKPWDEKTWQNTFLL